MEKEKNPQSNCNIPQTNGNVKQLKSYKNQFRSLSISKFSYERQIIVLWKAERKLRMFSIDQQFLEGFLRTLILTLSRNE